MRSSKPRNGACHRLRRDKPMANLTITIAICTWNRSASLSRTLTSLRDMQIPAGIEWEVVVINNNSTDDTAEILTSFTAILPLRIFFERRQGLSYARNCAVEAARGDYIL